MWLTPSAQYQSMNDIAEALGCDNVYTELTIPVVPSNLAVENLSDCYCREALSTVLITCPAHLWSVLTQWQVTHMDATGCLMLVMPS